MLSQDKACEECYNNSVDSQKQKRCQAGQMRDQLSDNKRPCDTPSQSRTDESGACFLIFSQQRGTENKEIWKNAPDEKS